jgi:DtxR family Mn-dependent transcriptional regulator
MEHALSPETLDSFTDFMAFIEGCPRTGENWLDYFNEFRREGCLPDKCQARTEIIKCEFQEKVEKNKKEEE